jgi:hypothetical protein
MGHANDLDFWQSSVGKARRQTARYYLATVNADGTFRFEDIPAGRYRPSWSSPMQEHPVGEVDVPQLVERSRYAAGGRDVLAASHYSELLMICTAGIFTNTG